MSTIGATWNKWNLHIHTPGTVKNDNFKGEWEKYINKLEESDVKVLGITDYYLINNYKKVKELKDSGRLRNIELLVINIEMRLENSTLKDRGVNYHILFSEEVYQHIQNKFLNKLTFIYQEQTFNATKDDFISLGKKFLGKDDISDVEALETGIDQFKVNFKEVKKILNENKSIFDGNYLIGVAHSSKDGVSGIRDNQMRGIREEILRSCDFIFTSNPGDIEYFSNLNDKKVPCIHGCDAHTLEKVCNPDLDRHTWIKAELSFDGLKQIVHEPVSRIKIQKNHPDEKKDYEVIKSITINDETSIFGKQTINFTSGLNTIIGGKSSGKSLLLYKIAQSINNEFINEITSEKLWNNNYSDTIIERLDTTIKWRDNNESNKEKQVGNITYIPQMYINELAEREDSEILQNKLLNYISENLDTKSELDKLKELEKETINDNYQQIQTIDEQNFLKNDLDKKKSEIGSLLSIEQELEKIKSDITAKINESNISKKESEEYNKLKRDIKEKKEELVAKREEIKKIETISKETTDKYNNFIKNLETNTYPSELSEQYKLFKQNISDINKIFINEINQVMKIKEDEKTLIDNRIIKLEEEIVPYKILMEKRDEIEKLEINKATEESKITSIKNYDEEIKKTMEIRTSSVSQIKLNSLNYYKALNLIIEKINRDSVNFNDVTIVCEYKENDISFEKFLEKINQRSYLPKDLFISKNRDYEINFVDQNINTFIENINRDIENILILPKSKFKKNENVYTVLESYLQPKLGFHLTLRDNDELISKMSPGKSGLVILKLLINSLNDNHPILIDQPEDNLDNRTISTDLVKTIREVSEQRQVIMVTHNANLVVLTDSENVIIANQDRLKEENYQYNFEYINGPLESNITKQDKGLLKEKGIKTHIFDILEGGQKAFSIREKRYEVSYDK